MSGLKPIGSEKLTGDDKLKRIIEISNFNNKEKQIKEDVYKLYAPNGKRYNIVREKSGYIIKEGVDELKYMDRIENLRYFKTYGQALKKLNLIIKDIKEVSNIKEDTPLLSEKRYILKNPNPEPEVEPQPQVEPQLDNNIDTEKSDDMSVDDDVQTSDDMGDEMDDDNVPVADKTSIRVVQSLTGKLTQKLRELTENSRVKSSDIKYVFNSLLSAIDITILEDEDKDDILKRFGIDDYTIYDNETGDDLDDLDDSGIDTGEEAIDVEEDYHITEVKKYLEKRVKLIEAKNKITELCESKQQLSKSLELLKENDFIGKTNLNNIVFKNKDNNEIKVDINGSIL